MRLIAGLCAIVLIAVADRTLNDAIPLALVYMLPVVGMSTVLRRWQIPVLGLLCTVVAELSDAFQWTVAQGVPRDALYFLAYTAAGLYVSEALSRRRAEQTHVAALEAEIEVRRGFEEQLRLVVANASIAIVTLDENGEILQANDAAERLFSSGSKDSEPALTGLAIEEFMPSLARVQIRRHGWEKLRTMMQCQGLRASREPFLADVWFSTYMTSTGGRLTAMIVDSSIEMRDREEANLEQVLVGSRLVMGALLHEIRNICAAISVVQQNLATASQGAHSSEDFDALHKLVTALERMASSEVALAKREAIRLRLDTFLRELHIIISPSLRENGIELCWHVDAELPEVLADPHSLLQVFLNLVRNAEKALTQVPEAHLKFRAYREGATVRMVVSDNGPGVDDPNQLFRPFGATKENSGLGLYLSRAMMLSFSGDLRYEPSPRGATFTVYVVAVEAGA